MAATALLYLAGLGLLALSVVSVVPVVQSQVEDFRGQWPKVQARVESWIDDREKDLRGTPLEFSREDLAAQFNGRMTDQLPPAVASGRPGPQMARRPGDGAMLAFYLLADLQDGDGLPAVPSNGAPAGVYRSECR